MNLKFERKGPIIKAEIGHQGDQFFIYLNVCCLRRAINKSSKIIYVKI